MHRSLFVIISGLLVFLVILLVGSAVLSLRFVNLDRVKDLLTTQVYNATGRTLTITGPLEFKVGMVPTVVAHGVRLTNPAGSTRPEMIRIDRFEMQIALLPLLDREIAIRRLLLAKPDILIETDALGPRNLDFNKPIPKSGSATQGSVPPTAQQENPSYRFTINEVKIINGIIGWHNRSSTTTENMEFQELILQRDPVAASVLATRLYAKIGKRAIEINGTVGGAATLIAGTPWPFDLKAEIEGLTLNAAGKIADLPAFRGLQVKVEAHGPELSEAVRLAGLAWADLPDKAGPFKFQGNLNDTGGRLNLVDVAVEAGERGVLLLNATGTVKDLAKTAIVDLAVHLESDNPSAVARLAGTNFLGRGPVQLTGQVRGSDRTWDMKGLKASLGGSDLGGELNLQFAARPRLSGKIAGSSLRVSDFLPSTATITATTENTEPSPVNKASDADRLFSGQSLHLDRLRALDADLDLQVGTLITDDRQLTDVAIIFELNAGRMKVSSFRFGLAGGRVEGSASIDAAGTAPAVTLALKGQQIDLGKLHPGGPISGGQSALQVDLQGRGDSVRALMASATGEASLSVGEGRLRNRTIDRATTNPLLQVISALNPFVKKEESTQITCGAVRLVLRDGVAKADRGIAMRTSQVDVVGSGTVNLRSEQLDLYFKPRARVGLGFSLSSSLAGLVKVGGTLVEPSIHIDAAGTLRTAASIGAGFATGGLSEVGEMLFDRVAGDDDPCQTALGHSGQQQGTQNKKIQQQRPGSLLRELFGR